MGDLIRVLSFSVTTYICLKCRLWDEWCCGSPPTGGQSPVQAQLARLFDHLRTLLTPAVQHGPPPPPPINPTAPPSWMAAAGQVSIYCDVDFLTINLICNFRQPGISGQSCGGRATEDPENKDQWLEMDEAPRDLVPTFGFRRDLLNFCFLIFYFNFKCY